MPKSKNPEGDYVISETGNWNVADSFSKIKVMVPLATCDIYEDIARYGYDSFFEELDNVSIDKDELKIRGLDRLINELIKLAKNTRFAMKKEKTQEEMKTLEKHLYKIRDKILPFATKTSVNHRDNTKSVKIDKKIFNRILEAVSEIKSDMNNPLNRNHLIFTDKEEFDPIAFKNRIKDRIINRG